MVVCFRGVFVVSWCFLVVVFLCRCFLFVFLCAGVFVSLVFVLCFCVLVFLCRCFLFCLSGYFVALLLLLLLLLLMLLLLLLLFLVEYFRSKMSKILYFSCCSLFFMYIFYQASPSTAVPKNNTFLSLNIDIILLWSGIAYFATIYTELSFISYGG